MTEGLWVALRDGFLTGAVGVGVGYHLDSFAAGWAAWGFAWILTIGLREKTQ